MTLLNQGNNRYEVVAIHKNTWNGHVVKEKLLITPNLLVAYERVLEEEAALEAFWRHNAGSPYHTRVVIDVYIGGEGEL